MTQPLHASPSVSLPARRSAARTALSALALAGAVALLPTGAGAAPSPFVNNTIASRIPASDLPSFQSAIARTLEDTPDGQSSEWTSSPGRRKAPVTFTLRPSQTTQTKSAGVCRLLTADVRQGNASEGWRFWFCKPQGGGWKASGSHHP